MFGGIVANGVCREDGQFPIEIDTTCSLFKLVLFWNIYTVFRGLSKQESVLLTHGDFCVDTAKGFEVVAQFGNSIAGRLFFNVLKYFLAFANEEKKMYGLQFHPEVELTCCGSQILSNFCYDICGFKGDFQMGDRLEACKSKIRNIVGQRKVMVSQYLLSFVWYFY